ncbi:sarcosine oxidase subunit gamma [Pseudonocardia spinosispora]|uniref:sarcosine oxidase subunit gamma n=1 Tax=Pseudonocardia spinosispora TaxID=103441 RepID=UPI0003F8BE43|nr:sarcosine oxidase subunit gamma family protein [Pseudonocardia spinosispora]
MTVESRAARRSPLAGWRTGTPNDVELVELAFRSAVALRVDPDSPAIADLSTSLGVELPVAPNAVATVANRAILRLAPEEWLIVGPDEDVTGFVETLRGALGGRRGAVVDVSAERTTIEVSGRFARELLEKGCPLDLHPRAFTTGRCAHTPLAKVTVLLWQVSGDDTPVYRLLVHASLATYLAAWLTDAGAEFWPVPRAIVPGRPFGPTGNDPGGSPDGSLPGPFPRGPPNPSGRGNHSEKCRLRRRARLVPRLGSRHSCTTRLRRNPFGRLCGASLCTVPRHIPGAG